MHSIQRSQSEPLEIEIKSSHILLKISQCFYLTKIKVTSPCQSLEEHALAPSYFLDLIFHFSHPLPLPLFLLFFSLKLIDLPSPPNLCICCPFFLGCYSPKWSLSPSFNSDICSNIPLFWWIFLPTLYTTVVFYP